ncbi:MAG TPA: HNH endonuclease signature motif containing protein [Blastocatellia bacterium]|nr:HNH endonuclease signature motif containing protein [Blastocatellia bacterium]
MSEKHIPAERRRVIRDQANGICEYCRSQECFSPQRFSVEHIKPRSAGGQPTRENLALSCQGCNGHKYTKQKSPDPVTGDVVALFHPRRQRWRDHFAWSVDASLIVGLTPVGRATVEALRMNRIELVNLREVLYGAQKHPPAEPDEEYG